MKKLAMHLAPGLVLFTFATARSDVPQQVNFQGLLTDSTGVSVGADTLQVVFTIYDAAAGGTSKWTETDTVFTDSAGRFTILLGLNQPVPDTVFNDSARWLGIQVQGDPEMTPRIKLVTVPYSYMSDSTQATFGGGGGAGGWLDQGTVVTLLTLTDSVGIGTPSPSTKLEVTGNVRIVGKATIGDGHTNTGTGAFVAGDSSTASGLWSTVGGGHQNVSSNDQTSVAGGAFNTASGLSSVVGGGYQNAATVTDATVSGGYADTASAAAAVIGGGALNTANGVGSTIGGGRNNVTTGESSTIAGGWTNTASATDATVGGGADNVAGGFRSTVGGGNLNSASGAISVVGGGTTNSALGDASTVSGGGANLALGLSATVGGGSSDTASAYGATIAGGITHHASGQLAAVGGGIANRASGYAATIAGGEVNLASGDNATVGGGFYDTASATGATVGGGSQNTASGIQSTVSGGIANDATETGATVSGGEGNRAGSSRATVGGGWNNLAGGDNAVVAGGASDTATGLHASISGGYNNRATNTGAAGGGGSGNLAGGVYATVPGGNDNTANGQNSLAAGYNSQADHDGCFVWSGASGLTGFLSSDHYQFLADADFYGFGRNYRISSQEVFGIRAEATGYGGMYMETSGASGSPFYGYATDSTIRAYHYWEGFSGRWILYNNGHILSLTDAGYLGVDVVAPTHRIELPNVAGASGRGLASAWVTFSSRRWKTNIETIPDALQKVSRLRGVTYDWKSSGIHDVGLIAEEVGEVIPEVVAYEENGVDAQSVDYARLVAVLIEAVKELDATVKQQQEQIDRLEQAQDVAQNAESADRAELIEP